MTSKNKATFWDTTRTREEIEKAKESLLGLLDEKGEFIEKKVIAALDDKLNSFSKMKFEIIQSESEVINPDVIYLIKREEATGVDKYEEWILIDGMPTLIGDTSAELVNSNAKLEIIDVPASIIVKLAESTSYVGLTDEELSTFTEYEGKIFKANLGEQTLYFEALALTGMDVLILANQSMWINVVFSEKKIRRMNPPIIDDHNILSHQVADLEKDVLNRVEKLEYNLNASPAPDNKDIVHFIIKNKKVGLFIVNNFYIVNCKSEGTPSNPSYKVTILDMANHEIVSSDYYTSSSLPGNASDIGLTVIKESIPDGSITSEKLASDIKVNVESIGNIDEVLDKINGGGTTSGSNVPEGVVEVVYVPQTLIIKLLSVAEGTEVTLTDEEMALFNNAKNKVYYNVLPDSGQTKIEYRYAMELTAENQTIIILESVLNGIWIDTTNKTAQITKTLTDIELEELKTKADDNSTAIEELKNSAGGSNANLMDKINVIVETNTYGDTCVLFRDTENDYVSIFKENHKYEITFDFLNTIRMSITITRTPDRLPVSSPIYGRVNLGSGEIGVIGYFDMLQFGELRLKIYQVGQDTNLASAIISSMTFTGVYDLGEYK